MAPRGAEGVRARAGKVTRPVRRRSGSSPRSGNLCREGERQRRGCAADGCLRTRRAFRASKAPQRPRERSATCVPEYANTK